MRAGAIALEDGTPAYREVVDHPGGVCVLPWDGERVTLVRQYRIAVGYEVLEAPAGKLEPGDDPAQRARQELLEETGFVAQRLTDAGIVFASVGYCSERIHLFIAHGKHEVLPQPEPEERIAIEQYALPEVVAMLRENQLSDAKTCVLLHRFLGMLVEL